MKKLLGPKEWIKNNTTWIASDDTPTNSSIGRIQMIHDGSIIGLKTRAQAEWFLQSLAEAINHAWGSK